MRKKELKSSYSPSVVDILISVDDDSTQNKTLEVMVNKFYDSLKLSFLMEVTKIMILFLRGKYVRNLVLN